MNRDFENTFELKRERVPTEKERQWKLNEEKEKAKQSARVKQLDFARPVSATEPWKARTGQFLGDRRRPHSAKFECESAQVAGDNAENATTPNSAFIRWGLPSEGEGDGSRLTRVDGNGSDQNPLTEESRYVEEEDVEEEDIEEEDIEDVLIADYEEVVTPKRSPDMRMENTFTGEAMESDDELVHEETPRQISISPEQTARGAVFTPLIPITDEFEDYNETDKEDSLSDPPETPTIVHQEDESKPNDDDEEDESGPDATIKDEKPEENEADRNDQLAETQAEEHLMTHGHQEDFLLMPIPQTFTRAFRCRVIRRAAGCFELFAESISGEDKLLMTAKKKKAAAATTYAMYAGGEITGESNDDHGRNLVEMGGVKANLLGTNFTVFRRPRKDEKVKTGISLELAVITYEPNVLGLKGPRRIGVVVPGMTSDGNRVTLKSKDHDSDSIVARMKYNAKSPHLIRMENKAPTWNEDLQSFVLNFSGRVTKASIKNFQIVHTEDPDYIVFQFGRVSETEFTLDFRYPLCPIQAFGCALSSMNRKLACE